VPGVFGKDLVVSAIKPTHGELAVMLFFAALEAKGVANTALDTAKINAKSATAAILALKKRLEDLAAGVKPKEAEVKPFLRDTFAKKDDELWKVQSGQWAWEAGKLVCKTASTFATVSAKKESPAALMGRIKYK